MNRMIKLISALVFVVILNIGLFTFATISLTSFWISWVFIHIAFLILVCTMIFSVPEQKKLISAYSESTIAIYYFIVELIAGLVLMFQFAFFPVVAFVIQAIILAAFVIAFFAVKKMHRNIDKREYERDVDLKHFKYLQEAMKNVLNQVDYTAPYKKVVEHAYDALAGSQVRSSQEAYQHEQNILSLVNQLKSEVEAENEEMIRSLCKKIENEVAERNSKLLISR